MHRRRSMVLPARALAFALVGAALLALGGCARPVRLAAVAGVLDLSHWSATADGPALLGGNWTLYRGQLLTPADFAGPSRPSGATTVHVPGEWWSEGLPATGYGTLRLQVRLPSGTPPLAVAMPYVCSAYRLWVDGTPAAAAGRVGTDYTSESPAFVPRVAAAVPRDGMLDLLLQVSNFHHRCGGLARVPALGPAVAVAAGATRRLALAMALFGAVFAMAAYHFVVFGLRREERSALPFGVFCALMAVRLLVTGAMPLPQVWAGLPWGVQLRLEYVSDYCAPLALLLFLRCLYPREFPVWLVRVQGVIAAVGVASLLLPLSRSSWLLPFAAVVLLLVAGYGVCALLVAAARRRGGALLLLLGSLPMLAILVREDLVSEGLVASAPVLAPGAFLLVLAQASLLARRFALAFTELRQFHRLLTEREEDVRKEISESLHGRVQTRLLLAGRTLEEVEGLLRDGSEPARARALAAQVRLEIDDVRETDIRDVSHRLHPSIIVLGLLPAVRALEKRFAGHLDVHVEVAESLREMDAVVPSPMPEVVRLAAYRILEEALANVAAHAEATSARIHLGLTPGGALHLEVTDDGHGFAGGEARTGLGLRTIADRVEAVAGQWEIHGRPGRGATMSATLPLTVRASGNVLLPGVGD